MTPDRFKLTRVGPVIAVLAVVLLVATTLLNALADPAGADRTRTTVAQDARAAASGTPVPAATAGTPLVSTGTVAAVPASEPAGTPAGGSGTARPRPSATAASAVPPPPAPAPSTPPASHPAPAAYLYCAPVPGRYQCYATISGALGTTRWFQDNAAQPSQNNLVVYSVTCWYPNSAFITVVYTDPYGTSVSASAYPSCV